MLNSYHYFYFRLLRFFELMLKDHINIIKLLMNKILNFLSTREELVKISFKLSDIVIYFEICLKNAI